MEIAFEFLGIEFNLPGRAEGNAFSFLSFFLTVDSPFQFFSLPFRILDRVA